MAFRDRNRAEGPFNLNLTPLLDVVLQLITFFMMLIHFGTKIDDLAAPIKLPTAPSALPGGDLGLDRLVVGVDSKGRLIADGGALEGPSVGTWWADQSRRRRAGGSASPCRGCRGASRAAYRARASAGAR